MKFSMTATLLLFAVLAAGCSDEDSTNQPQLSYTTAQEYLADSGFQGVALIQKGEETLVHEGFGLARSADQTPNHVQLKYRIGSMTKAFTALAVVQLKSQGLITSFDDPVATYFPDFPRGDEITLRHLLTHRSGLPDYLGFVDQDEFHTPEELVEAVMEEPLNFTPGTAMEYSNTNFAALGVLIETLTETSYQNYLQTSVLDPLNLSNTEYGTGSIVGPAYAQGYRKGNPVAPIDMSVPYAAGALVSNLDDLALWAQAMLDGTLMSIADRAAVFPAAPSQHDHNNVGMGWFSLNNHGQTVFHHGGDIDGFTSLIALFPRSDGYIILLSNEETQSQLRYDILENVMEHEFQ
jgi:CubicO group peptidase (beta-lactamase class C family)